MKTFTRAFAGIATATAFAALLLTAGGGAARADDWEYYGRGHVYRDIQDLRRDQRILDRLEDRRDYLRRSRDWDAVRALDRRIAELRRHIDHDRRDLRRDIDRIRDERYRDRDDYRSRDRDDFRFRDRSDYRVRDRDWDRRP